LQLNASAANGLATCSIAQVGFTGFAELDKASEPGVQTPQFTPRVKNRRQAKKNRTCARPRRVSATCISRARYWKAN